MGFGDIYSPNRTSYRQEKLFRAMFELNPNVTQFFYLWIGANSVWIYLLKCRGWLMRMRLAWKKSQNTLDTSKRLHWNETEAPRVWAKDLNTNFVTIRNCRIGNRQGRHSLEGPGRGWNPYPGAQPTTRLLVVWRPQSKVFFYDNL